MTHRLRATAPGLPRALLLRPLPLRAILRAILLVWIAAAAGCGGGPRPSLPDGADSGDIALILSAADSSMARGAAAEGQAGYARAARAARARGDRGLEARAETGQGLAYLAQGEAGPARRSLVRSVALDPGNAAAHVALGRLLVATRRYRDAKEEFEKGAALDTTSAEPWCRLGLAYSEMGEPRLAAEAFERALGRDPSYAPALRGLRGVQESRCIAAGLPAEYAGLRESPSVTRGELAVMLAAELGADPERPSWRGATVAPPESEETRGAWGERWLRAAAERGWIVPYPDGSYHLGDPVTRGALALLLAGIERTWPARATQGEAAGSEGAGGSEADPARDVFSDLGSRHYLFRAAVSAVRLGLPVRPGGKFEPWASATGSETLLALSGLARALGAQPVLSEEPSEYPMVK
jgi:tetratricopeptide (TPR) repeat protein